MLTHLLRHRHDDMVTGKLIIDDIEVDTLELPWIDNKLGESCIPDGIYRYRRDYSANKKRDVIELLACDTAPRSQIQIHAAKVLEHLKGCIGVPSLEEERMLFDAMGDHGIIKISTIE